MTATLCLNMIVRNEVANLERCLTSVADHIDCWAIGDTGSTDGTRDLIRTFFAQRSIPGELHEFPFKNFEQARNEALDRARTSSLTFDYLLLCDADMELVVENPDFRDRLAAPCYDLLQRNEISYWNARILRRDASARYRGVTHEYLEVAERSQRLDGAWFRDHASGANRANKLHRDIRLLADALQADPDNLRYLFYLAQSLRESGQLELAAKVYARRAKAGGWDEEAWYARLQQARCLLALHDDASFVHTALAAFNQRPRRAEPLYDLARYYRERGMHDAGAMFAEAGMAIPQPEGDSLFIEDAVYTAGLREEFSIVAFYLTDPRPRSRGHAVCEWLALSRQVPEATRSLARSNLTFYSGPASDLMPSFRAGPLRFRPPDGWTAINPSIACHDGRLILAQRCVNFRVTETGQYQTFDGSPLATRNVLLHLDADLRALALAEILPPADLPPPAFDLVLGFEELRPFAWNEALWCISTVRQMNPDGRCEQVLARIGTSADLGPCRLADWRVLRPDGPREHEMNWMPLGSGGDPLFIRGCEPGMVVDNLARPVAQTTPAVAAETFRGGTQAIEFDGGWLALVHEVSERDGRRMHWHRFVWFDAVFVLRAVSRRFFWQRPGVEVASGLARHPDGVRLLISFGVGEAEAWIASVDVADVAAILAGADEFLGVGAEGGPVGVPGRSGTGRRVASSEPVVRAAQ